MEKQMKRRIIWAVLAVLVMGVIFAFSTQNTSTSEALSDQVAELLHVEKTEENTRASNRVLIFGLTLRKLAHIFLFCCLGFCVTQALFDWKWQIPGAVAISYLYAVFDELHQHWQGGRHGRWQDTLIDLIGIVIGTIGAILITKLWELIRKKTGRQT